MCLVDCGRYLSTHISCSGGLSDSSGDPLDSSGDLLDCSGDLLDCSHDSLDIGILSLGETVADSKSIILDVSFTLVESRCLCQFALPRITANHNVAGLFTD